MIRMLNACMINTRMMNKGNNMLRRSLFILILLSFAGLLQAQPSLQEEAKRLEEQADALLALSPAAQKEQILKMSASEAEALMSTLSRRALAKNPEAAPVFYLYEHLASLDAIELAQKRLDRLLAVFVVTLLLFVAYLLFLLMQQNKIVKTLRSQHPTAEGRPVEQVKVYRGE